MPTDQKVLKGFVKTETAILLIIVGIAFGFAAGVVFSAYHSSRRFSVMDESAVPQSIPLSSQQAAARDTLLIQTRDNPEDIEAWIHLGHFYFDSGQPEKAIEAYQTALDLDDTRPDVWTDMGVMYRRVGNPKKAVQSFDKALLQNPSHEIAMFNKGIVLMHDLQDPAGALHIWEKLVQTNPMARTPNGVLVKEMIEQFKPAPQ
jgi:cytochrome c-type biogenesis protein CcmH/NrfG